MNLFLQFFKYKKLNIFQSIMSLIIYSILQVFRKKMSFNSKAFEENLTMIYDLVSGRYEQAVVTGSAAIVWLVLHHPDLAQNAQEHFVSLGYDNKTGPNDVDIISVQNTDIYERKIGPFESIQGPIGSKTFSYGDKSFDIIKTGSCAYIDLDGINIIHPASLITHYEENYRESDELKLTFLLENEHLFGRPVNSFSAKQKQSRANNQMMGCDFASRLNFSDDEESESVSNGTNRQLMFEFDEDINLDVVKSTISASSINRKLF
jgi:hypothetical protein